jgi:hypothetical protein
MKRPAPSCLARPHITVARPGVHMAGSDAHYDAHIEVGQHGFEPGATRFPV